MGEIKTIKIFSHKELNFENHHFKIFRYSLIILIYDRQKDFFFVLNIFLIFHTMLNLFFFAKFICFYNSEILGTILPHFCYDNLETFSRAEREFLSSNVFLELDQINYQGIDNSDFISKFQKEGEVDIILFIANTCSEFILAKIKFIICKKLSIILAQKDIIFINSWDEYNDFRAKTCQFVINFITEFEQFEMLGFKVLFSIFTENENFVCNIYETIREEYNKNIKLRETKNLEYLCQSFLDTIPKNLNIKHSLSFKDLGTELENLKNKKYLDFFLFNGYIFTYKEICELNEYICKEKNKKDNIDQCINILRIILETNDQYVENVKVLNDYDQIQKLKGEKNINSFTFLVINIYVNNIFSKKFSEYIFVALLKNIDFQNCNFEYYLLLFAYASEKKHNISNLVYSIAFEKVLQILELYDFYYRPSFAKRDKNLQLYIQKILFENKKSLYRSKANFKEMNYFSLHSLVYNSYIFRNVFLDDIKKLDFYCIIHMIFQILSRKNFENFHLKVLQDLCLDSESDLFIRICCFISLKNVNILKIDFLFDFFRSILNKLPNIKNVREILIKLVENENVHIYHLLRVLISIKYFDQKSLRNSTQIEIIILQLFTYDIAHTFQNSQKLNFHTYLLEFEFKRIYKIIESNSSNLILTQFIDFMISIRSVTGVENLEFSNLHSILQMIDCNIIKKISPSFIFHPIEIRLAWLAEYFSGWTLTDIIPYEKCLKYDYSTLKYFFEATKTNNDEKNITNFLYSSDTLKFFLFLEYEKISANIFIEITEKHKNLDGIDILKAVEKDIILLLLEENFFMDKKKRTYVHYLIDLGWKFEHLKILFQKILKSNHNDLLFEVLYLLYSFRISADSENKNGKKLLEILLNSEDDTILNEMNDFLIENCFENSDYKNEKTIIDEFFLRNFHIKEQIIKKNQLEDMLNNINFYYQQKIFGSSNTVKEFTAYDIRNLLNDIKINTNTDNLSKILAIIKRAIEIDKGIKLRETQLISVIYAIFSESSICKILQVETGEGKSLIIIFVAIYYVLSGKKVDIITSSETLAVPQSEEMKTLCDMFGINVSSNCKSDVECYNSDIIYGTINQFTADHLSDKFNNTEELNGRKNEFLIIDEADDILLDGITKRVFFGASSTSSEFLNPIYVKIWQVLNCFSLNIFFYDENVFLINQLFLNNYSGSNSLINLFTIRKIKENKNQRFFIVPNAYNSLLNDDFFIQNKNDFLSEFLIEEVEVIDLFPYLKHKINEIIKNLFTKDHIHNQKEHENDLKKLKFELPHHLKTNILRNMLDKYIENAIYAKFNLHENQDYIISAGEIKIVDKNFTGCILQKSSWSDGLHQFLELKHGLVLTDEDIVTNFQSYYSFIKLYDKKIFGLSGSIGSEKEIKFLENENQALCLEIPTFKNKRFYELKPIFEESQISWIEQIVNSILIHVSLNKVVLVILENISRVYEFEKQLKEKNYDSSKIIIYEKNENLDRMNRIFKPKEIILSTNLAGRGTDIKLDPVVNQNGGLHVCITFLPRNHRIYSQNRGRTSRCGNKGTSQCILNKKESNKISDAGDIFNSEFEKNERDHIATLNEKITKIVIEDEIFNEFCKFLKKSNFVLKESISEQFGLWLEEHQSKLAKISSKSEKIQFFEDSFLKKMEQPKNKINNPHFFLNDVSSLEHENFEKAIEICDNAIYVDLENVYFESYYIKSFYLIREAENVFFDSEYEKKMHKVINALDNARKIIENCIMPSLKFMLLYLENNTQTYSQIKVKFIIFNFILESIDSKIGIKEEDKLEKKLHYSNSKYNDLSNEILKSENQEIRDFLFKKRLQIEKDIEMIKKKIKHSQSSDEAAKEKNLSEIGQIRYLIKEKQRIKVEKESLEDMIKKIKNISPEKISKLNFNTEIIKRKECNLYYLYNLEISDKRDFFSISILTCCGILEMLGGFFLCAKENLFAQKIGFQLVKHGFFDVIAAIKLIYNGGNFSLKDWLIQKGFDMGFDLCLAGIDAIVEKGINSASLQLYNFFRGSRDFFNFVENLSRDNVFRNSIKILSLEFFKDIGIRNVSKYIQEIITSQIFEEVKKKLNYSDLEKNQDKNRVDEDKAGNLKNSDANKDFNDINSTEDINEVEEIKNNEFFDLQILNLRKSYKKIIQDIFEHKNVAFGDKIKNFIKESTHEKIWRSFRSIKSKIYGIFYTFGEKDCNQEVIHRKIRGKISNDIVNITHIISYKIVKELSAIKLDDSSSDTLKKKFTIERDKIITSSINESINYIEEKIYDFLHDFNHETDSNIDENVGSYHFDSGSFIKNQKEKLYFSLKKTIFENYQKVKNYSNDHSDINFYTSLIHGSQNNQDEEISPHPYKHIAELEKEYNNLQTDEEREEKEKKKKKILINTKFKYTIDMAWCLKFFCEFIKNRKLDYFLIRGKFPAFTYILENDDLKKIFRDFYKENGRELVFEIYVNDKYMFDFYEKNTKYLFFFIIINKISNPIDVKNTIVVRELIIINTIYPKPDDITTKRAIAKYRFGFF